MGEHRPTPGPIRDRDEPAVRARFGRCVILGRLGAGGMGTVFRARHDDHGEVCIKIIAGLHRSRGDLVRRFKREAEAAQRIDHVNVVRAFGVEEMDDRVAIVQEYVPGGDLDDRLAAHGGVLALTDVLWVGRGIARGLAAAHALGLVHRDLKPGNVLLDAQRRPKVADFGLVLQVDGKPLDGRTILTRRGQALGTPMYMAPEQWRSAHDVDQRTDIYALGALLHYLLAGRLPFDKSSIMNLMRAHLRDPPVPLREHVPSAPPALEALIGRLLEKDRDDRPADANEVADAIDAIAVDLGVTDSLQPDETATSVQPRPRGRSERPTVITPDPLPGDRRSPSDPDAPTEIAPGGAPPLPPDDRPEKEGLIGAVLGGKFELHEVIGRGGMGTVFRARHTLLDEEFALKVIRSAYARHPEFRSRLLREAKALLAFSHPAAVTLREFGEHAGTLYMALDYASGRTLRDVLRDEGPFDEERALGVARQVLPCLAAAHEAGIVHRDLKPANLMVEPRDDGDDRVRVLDFGIAKVLDAAAAAVDADEIMTGDGAAIGTPHYMSPEQATGDPVDVRSDVYSIGCVLYELVSGHLPIGGDTEQQLIVRIVMEPPTPLEEVAARPISTAFVRAVMAALAKEPADRPKSAFELLGLLEGRSTAASAGALPTIGPTPAGGDVYRSSRDILGGVFAGKYEVLGVVKTGRSGSLFRVRHVQSRRELSLRVATDASARVRERFLRHATQLQGFVHERTATLRDFGEEGGLLYVVLDRIEGETLRDRVARDGPLSEEAVIDLAEQLLPCLQRAHDAGILHGKIKSTSVIFSTEAADGADRAWLVGFDTDFARSRRSPFVERYGEQFTSTASPEQTDRDASVDSRSDIHSFAAVLHYALTGEPAFHAGTIKDLVLAVRRFKPRPLHETGVGLVSPAVGEVLARALAKDPAVRPQTAQALLEGLEASWWDHQSDADADPATGEARRSERKKTTSARAEPAQTPARADGPTAPRPGRRTTRRTAPVETAPAARGDTAKVVETPGGAASGDEGPNLRLGAAIAGGTMLLVAVFGCLGASLSGWTSDPGGRSPSLAAPPLVFVELAPPAGETVVLTESVLTVRGVVSDPDVGSIHLSGHGSPITCAVDEHGRFEAALILAEPAVEVAVHARRGPGDELTVTIPVIVDAEPPRLARVEVPREWFGGPLVVSGVVADANPARAVLALVVDGRAREPVPIAVATDGRFEASLDVPAGATTLKVRLGADDRAGHTAQPVEHPVALDRTAPMVTVREPSGPIATRGRSFRLIAELSDDGPNDLAVVVRLGTAELVSRLVALSGTRRATLDESLPLPEADGDLLLDLEVTDAAGHATRTSIGVTVDRSPPAASVVDPAGPLRVQSGRSVPVILRVTDPSGVRRVQVGGELLQKRDAEHWIGTVEPLAADDGLPVIVEDLLGNTSSAGVVPVVIDDLGPSVELISPDPSETTTLESVRVRVHVADPGGGEVATVVVGRTALSPAGEGDWVGWLKLAPGANRIVLSATDDAGNVTRHQFEVTRVRD